MLARALHKTIFLKKIDNLFSIEYNINLRQDSLEDRRKEEDFRKISGRLSKMI
jgi:hypothetical protein